MKMWAWVRRMGWEEALVAGLRRHNNKWDSRDGDRDLWLTSCRNSESVIELAELGSSKGDVRKLQSDVLGHRHNDCLAREVKRALFK